ncbi:phosphoribosyl-ATP pyrophosphohydrolase [Catalinimonas alkaloidigena]|uniref:phosphoribosyl-ATP diphosphatase n=1 Tax=Catalinimonas alkaloidigena TaxID=1075417 RepID=UPI003B8A64E2|nr:phosphoribosyl-ATP pyrophosphohydrolase [Catalinimonas alkaloidigena]
MRNNKLTEKNLAFINQLLEIINSRHQDALSNKDTPSYTASLFLKGINKIAQKVGEEAVELVIEAKDDNAELFKNEAADLLFHYLVLLEAKGFSLVDIIEVLEERHK